MISVKLAGLLCITVFKAQHLNKEVCPAFWPMTYLKSAASHGSEELYIIKLPI